MQKSQIFFATQTGNSQEVAEKLQEELEASGIEVGCVDMFDSDPDNISELSHLYYVVSTWGEGEPPDDSVGYFEKLKEYPDGHYAGKKFAICGLGDSGYDIFNGFGKDLESELVRLGGVGIVDRVDCDIDFEELSDPWIAKIVEHEKALQAEA
ncbi:MAG: hypothetical protein CMN06_12055 [Roseibacillus sp.]|nr:hypothetical protein [Roseibacillus sp.]|tara:strand:+ start:8482 stop:8940 length:459 start_codon:yes stop_codon:yes gene_type:complete